MSVQIDFGGVVTPRSDVCTPPYLYPVKNSIGAPPEPPGLSAFLPVFRAVECTEIAARILETVHLSPLP